MNIAKLNLAHPKIQYHIYITYSETRELTVMEWLIMSAANELQNDRQSEFNHYSVDLFFSYLFYIDNTNLLIKPVLSNLQDKGLLELNSPLKKETDLKNYAMSNIKLTDNGTKLFLKGVYPNSEKWKSTFVVYDPLDYTVKLGSHDKDLEEQYNGEPLILPENLTNTLLPTGIIENQLQKQRTSHNTGLFSWLTPKVSIKSVKLNKSENNSIVFWKNIESVISISDDMILAVDKNRNENICRPVLKILARQKVDESFSALPARSVSNIDKEFKSAILLSNAKYDFSNILNQENIFYLNQKIIDFQIDNNVQKYNNKVCIIGGANKTDVIFNSNLVVYLSDSCLYDYPTVVSATNSSVKHIGKFCVKVGEEKENVYLCFENFNNIISLKSFITSIVEKDGSENEDLYYLLYAVDQKSDFFNYLQTKIMQIQSLSELIEFIATFLKKIHVISPHLDDADKNKIKTIIQFYFDQTKEKPNVDLINELPKEIKDFFINNNK